MSTAPRWALKQVDAGLLSVGYAEADPADGPAVLLLHGWPYDIHSYAEVTPVLAAAGYRVIVPFARGYGTTRFRSDATVRNGQQAALAVDVTTLMDALGIGKAILGGYDWGGRSADVVAALWPDRCTGLVSVSGYLIGSQAAGSAYAGKFSGRYEHRLIEGGIGHNLPQEAPRAFAQAIIDVGGY